MRQHHRIQNSAIELLESREMLIVEALFSPDTPFAAVLEFGEQNLDVPETHISNYWRYEDDGTAIVEVSFPSPELETGNQTENLHAWLGEIYGSVDGPVTQQPWFRYFERAANVWESVIDVDFQFAGAADETRAPVRIRAEPIDQTGGVLAYSYLAWPPSIVIDSSDQFYNDTTQDSVGLVAVLVHEFGHILGLGHVAGTNKNMMEPILNKGLPDGSFLGPLDVELAREIYGSEDPPVEIAIGPNVIDGLAAAIDAANQMPGDVNIKLTAGQIVSGNLDITKTDGEIRISGPDTGRTIINGNGLGRVFDVHSGAELVLESLIVTGGLTEDAGGAIRNHGSVALFDTEITNSRASEGGGLFNAENATASFERTRFVRNTAHGANGGGLANRGVATIRQSAFLGNSAIDESNGGGVFNTGSLDLVESTIAGNYASAKGGGIYSIGALSSTSSTISGNASVHGAAGILTSGFGELNSLTITQNTSSEGAAAGIEIVDGPVTIANSIVAVNWTRSGQYDLSGPFVSAGGNLVGIDSQPSWNQETDLVGSEESPINPLLGPLQYNGGFTDTHAPTYNSPAINLGLAGNSPVSDQRGKPRISQPQNEFVDSGAVVYNARPTSVGGESPFFHDFETYDLDGYAVDHWPADGRTVDIDDEPGVFLIEYTGVNQEGFLIPPVVDFDSLFVDFLLEFPDGVPNEPSHGSLSIFRTQGLTASIRWGHRAPQLSIELTTVDTEFTSDFELDQLGRTRISIFLNHDDGPEDDAVRIWQNDVLTIGVEDAKTRLDESPATWLHFGGGNYSSTEIAPAPFAVKFHEIFGSYNPTDAIQAETPGILFDPFSRQAEPQIVTRSSQFPDVFRRANEFPGDQTILLVEGEFSIPNAMVNKNNGSITIRGSGSKTVLNGMSPGRLFTVNSGTELRLESLTLTGGQAQRGGAILNQGQLTLHEVTLVNNEAFFGGALFNDQNGALTVSRSAIRNNVSRNDGAGIYNLGDLSLNQTNVDNNEITGTGDGAGIFNGAILDIRSSAVYNNLSTSRGGGIYSDADGENLVIAKSTISGNQARLGGGGLFSSHPTQLIGNTISNNSSETSYGGGVAMIEFPAEVKNTIVAGNHSATSPDFYGEAISKGGNLIGINTSLGFTEFRDRLGTNEAPVSADLQPLRINGGPTPTHALEDTSAALQLAVDVPIDQADQRGVPVTTASGAFQPNSLPVASLGVTLIDEDFDDGTIEFPTDIRNAESATIVTGPDGPNDFEFENTIQPSGQGAVLSRNFVEPGNVFAQFSVRYDDLFEPQGQGNIVIFKLLRPGVSDLSLLLNQSDSGPSISAHLFSSAYKFGIDFDGVGPTMIVFSVFRDFENGTYHLWQNNELIHEHLSLPHVLGNSPKTVEFGARYEQDPLTRPFVMRIDDISVVTDPIDVIPPSNETTRFPQVNLFGGSALESDSLEFTIQVDGPITEAARLYLKNLDYTATAPPTGVNQPEHESADYQWPPHPSRQIDFVVGGETEHTVSIPIYDDNEFDPGEIFFVQGFNFKNLRIGKSRATGTIVDKIDVRTIPLAEEVNQVVDSAGNAVVIRGQNLDKDVSVIVINNGSRTVIDPTAITSAVTGNALRIALPANITGPTAFLLGGKGGASVTLPQRVQNHNLKDDGDDSWVVIIEEGETYNLSVNNKLIYVSDGGTLNLQSGSSNTVVAEVGASVNLGTDTTDTLVVHGGDEPKDAESATTEPYENVKPSFLGLYDISKPNPGDSNLDGVFNSSDLLKVFQAGEFSDGIENNSSFEDGDWDGDFEFDTKDLILAFRSGGFVATAIPLHARPIPQRVIASAIDAAFRAIDAAFRAIDVHDDDEPGENLDQFMNAEPWTPVPWQSLDLVHLARRPALVT